jgi:hypothetical protein
MQASALLVALLQAAVLWALHHSLTTRSWPAGDAGALAAIYLVAIWVPPVLLVLWGHRRQRLLWIAAGSLALFLAGSGYLAFAESAGAALSADFDDGSLLRFGAPLLIAWLMFLPMLRARLESDGWRVPYATLFRGSWRSYLMLAESLLFTGLFWLLLVIWAALFATLDHHFFVELFADPRFFYPATTLAFAAATQIIGSGDRLIDGVLDQLLGLLKWLLPLAGLIAVAFTLALLPRLPALLGSGERVISSAVMLALVAFSLLLINAAFRDGTSGPGYGALLQQLLRIVPVMLTVIAATALYSMAVRTDTLGLTPARYWGLIVAVFALAYSCCYTYAALRGGPWFGEIRRVNVVLAGALLLTLAVSLTPPGNALQWSVRSQAQRALEATAETDRESALRFLRFRGGEYGQRALRALAAGRLPGQSTANAAEGASLVPTTLRAAAARALALESAEPPQAYSAATPARYAQWRRRLRTLPQGREVPVALESVLREQFSRDAAILDPGGEVPAPLLAFIDVTADGREDALLWSGELTGTPPAWHRHVLFIADGDTWQPAAGGRSAR